MRLKSRPRCRQHRFKGKAIDWMLPSHRCSTCEGRVRAHIFLVTGFCSFGGNWFPPLNGVSWMLAGHPPPQNASGGSVDRLLCWHSSSVELIFYAHLLIQFVLSFPLYLFLSLFGSIFDGDVKTTLPNRFVFCFRWGRNRLGDAVKRFFFKCWFHFSSSALHKQNTVRVHHNFASQPSSFDGQSFALC